MNDGLIHWLYLGTLSPTHLTLTHILFWTSAFVVLHTYLFYPLILKFLHKEQRADLVGYPKEKVSILVAAYNEESVIEEKIRSVFAGSYDKENIQLLVGSDGSSDFTDEIVTRLCAEYPGLALRRFERQGKTSVINALMEEVKSDIVIFTDANVIFTEHTIRYLVQPFSKEEVGLVGATIQPRNEVKKGISLQESSYLARENRIKYREGELWGTMMGAFGGCFAIRKELFRPIPAEFLVDDFYITMTVLELGKSAILSMKATCLEDVSTKLSEEFRRKVRMSKGNFQNLKRFVHLIYNGRKGLGFSFLSHKVFRWITPIAICINLFCAFKLLNHHIIFLLAYWSQMLMIGLAYLEANVLKQRDINLKPLRYISYFYGMNLALLVGFIEFMKGVDSGMWEPTERNQ